MMIVYIENLPQNYEKYPYFVVRAVEGKVWFYGAWYTKQAQEAKAQAQEIDGFVVENPCDDDLFGEDY